MNVKIDTKEKFTVITPIDAHISANMTDELIELLHSGMQKEVSNVVLNLENVRSFERASGTGFSNLHSAFYSQNKSLVFCNVNAEIAAGWEAEDALDILNIVPTESEAWDIVQMEEIERELFSGPDEDANQIS